MNGFPYEFETEILAIDSGSAVFGMVHFPKEVVDALPEAPKARFRVDAEVGGHVFEAAVSKAGGVWQMMFSKRLQKLCNVEPGDRVLVQFDVADSERVDVPIELQHMLDANAVAQSVWERWTAGKRRGWAYQVASAKRPETREKRAFDVIDLLLAEAQ
ncbi:MAG TPA: hypothetical protein DDW52_21540 [Planctomycetaceae bacterium]|nr:hypothetical protein [Planctomycetaceae bacterium]